MKILKKRLPLLLGILLTAFIICLGTIYKNAKEIPSDFDQSIVIKNTEAFLLDKARLLIDGDLKKLESNSFFQPVSSKSKLEEKKVREEILEYAKTLHKSGLKYHNPIVILEIKETKVNSSGEIEIEANEEITFTINNRDTNTKFSNNHEFTYKKIAGEWKLIKDEITGLNSLALPSN